MGGQTGATDIAFLSVWELSAAIGRRQLSPVEVVTTLLERIDRHDGVLHTYITVCADQALAAARRAERDIMRGRRRGPLHGIPVSHKDISWTAGVRTTAHSRTLQDFVPAEDATHVRRLADAGMILLGKTSTTEFANGEMDLFGYTPNPWNLAYYTGGSSAGSASALAAGLAVATTGSDTGGSIRVPASFCGIVGLKPTYGRVSRYGVIPLSWTLDNAGPMTRTVRDCAVMLGAMAGHDPRDPSSADLPVPDFTSGLTRGLRGLVLGVPRQHYFEGLEPDVDRAVRTALRQFEALGARLEDVDLPHAGRLEPAYSVIIAAEAYAVHAARLRRQWALYGERSRRRIAAGACYTAAEYQHALQIRRVWAHELDGVLQRVDALVAPTLPYAAFTLETQRAGPPDSSWGTRQFNLSGHPALSIPCGFTTEGLPVGLQLAGRAFDEAMLFRIAHAYEQATAWHTRRPPMAVEPVAAEEGVRRGA
ncbi:MAG: amidase [Armatimonadota bacterium]|nr:amidase [Armatimonadota bacterium]